MKPTNTTQERAGSIWPESDKSGKVTPNVYWMKLNWTGFCKMFDFVVMEMLYRVRDQGIEAIRREIRNTERVLNILKSLESTWEKQGGWDVKPPGKATVMGMRLTFLTALGKNNEAGFAYFGTPESERIREMRGSQDDTSTESHNAPPSISSSENTAPFVAQSQAAAAAPTPPEYEDSGIPDGVYDGPLDAESAFESGVAEFSQDSNEPSQLDTLKAQQEETRKGLESLAGTVGILANNMEKLMEHITSPKKQEANG